MAKQMTKKQIEQTNNIIGWALAFSSIITYVINIAIKTLLSQSVSLPFDFILCLVDRESLKKQEVWKHGKIAWGWCLLTPVYLYKRCMLLKEDLTKFYINLFILILMIIWAFVLISPVGY